MKEEYWMWYFPLKICFHSCQKSSPTKGRGPVIMVTDCLLGSTHPPRAKRVLGQHNRGVGAVTVDVQLMADGELIAEARVCNFYVQVNVEK